MTTPTIDPRYMHLVEQLARLTTPEEEFEALKDADGHVEVDGVEYADVDEMGADMSDDRLMDEYAAFMEFVRYAKKIVKGEADAEAVGNEPGLLDYQPDDSDVLQPHDAWGGPEPAREG